MASRRRSDPPATPVPRRRSPIRRRLNLAGMVVLAALVTVWLVTWRTTRAMAESARRVAHTQEVIASIRGSGEALQEAETAQRGYLLTGREEYLHGYRRAAGRHHGEARRLRVLTRDNARQQARLDSLQAVVGARLALLDSLSGSLRVEGIEAAQAGVAQPSAQRYAAEIDRVLQALEREEAVLLAVRLREADARAERAARMVVATGLFTVLLLMGAAVIINRDVTRQQRDERELRRALGAADAASEAKSQFLATMSHEIRTPLNAVAGMSELLLDTPLNSEQAEFARTVHANAEALSLLIGDLLDSSKIEAGQVDLEPAPFDPRDLVEGVAEILIVRAEIKGVELVADIAPGVATPLVGDRGRLRQVLMNLVGNAVKFTEQGEVSVRALTEPVNGGRSARLHLAVRDTGIGIAPEAQERIFERFAQAERSTVRQYGGTGLGLNISRSLVELMGGILGVESEPGRGSTFHVWLELPLADPPPNPEVAPGRLEGTEVLLVDGNATRRESLAALLSFAGARVRAAASADEARAMARAWGGGVPVAVIDERVGEASGLELARALDEGGGPRPAVVLLCSLRSMLTGHVGEHGITQCVYKPVKQARLLQAVRQAAGMEEPQAPAPAAARPARVRSAPVPPRVLLVEDNRDNQALATRLLAGAGYQVELAENGREAVERVAAFRYDLVLMDVEMPVMDGIEATRRIREGERRGGRDAVPVVALTAHAVEAVRADALAAGMDDYTTKPVQREHLLEVCARWVDARPVVLVADDSPENHVLMGSFLGSAEVRVIYAWNGREAVDAFERQRVSLVLLDVDMPVMDGYDAARAIRRLPGGDRVPIVALTGYEGAEERQRCIRAGCTGYLTKPVRRRELVETVTRALGGVPDAGPVPPAPPAPAADTADGLPAARTAAHRLRGLLARRDFGGIAALGDGLRGGAAARDLHQLAAVGRELADAARRQDEARAAWWSDQVAPALREADRLMEVRRRAAGGASPDDDAYDRLARLAAALLHAPAAAVTLVDEHQQRMPGQAGFGAPLSETRTLPISHSFCRHVAERGESLLVEDARTDPLVRDNPSVEELGVIAYAGVPLTTPDGLTLGSVCAIDHQPRRWSDADVSVLRDLAAVAMRQMELERELASHPGATAIGDERGRARPGDAGGPADGWASSPSRELAADRPHPPIPAGTPTDAQAVDGTASDEPSTGSAAEASTGRAAEASDGRAAEASSGIAARTSDAGAADAPPAQVAADAAEGDAVVVEDDLADLVPGYVTARRRNVHAIRRLLAEGDLAGVQRLGHNMKGSGEGYGLAEVTRLGRELENAALAGDAAAIRRWNDALDGWLTRLSVRLADGTPVALEPPPSPESSA